MWNFCLYNTPYHKSLSEKFAQVYSYIPTRLVQEVQRHCSAMADEKDVALEEMRRKLTQGELDITRVLMDITRLVGSNGK